MAFELKDNSGTLFKNDRKEQETHADYQGEAKINGQLYWFNAWVKEGKTGKKFFSCSFREKQEKKPTAPKTIEDMVDDIPF